MKGKRVRRKLHLKLAEVLHRAVTKQDYNIFCKWMGKERYGKD